MISFIPFRLDIKEYPELNCFPLNTLLASYTKKMGRILMGSVLYKPDFSTFENKGGKRKMIYNNIYNSEFRLEYIYDETTGYYRCTKYWGKKPLGMTMGSDKNWNIFFANVGLLGLANGEKCEMKYLENNSG